MSDSRSHGQPSPGVCAGIVIAMLAMIAIPAAITLHAVHEPVPLVPVNQHSTPHDYTVSLLLFVFPITVIAGCFLPRGIARSSARLLADDCHSRSVGLHTR